MKVPTLSKKRHGNAGVPRPRSTGSLNKAAKLNEEVVREIRMAYRTGRLSVAKIAALVGINHHTAWCAIYGKTWRHCGGAADPVGGGNVAMRKLSDKQVRSARRLYSRGAVSIREIMECLGMNFNATRLMLVGETYRHVPMDDESDFYTESLSENVVEGILRRLHLPHCEDIHRAAVLAFLAGFQHGQCGRDGEHTEEEVMGAGNHEYAHCALDFDDLKTLSHAYTDHE